VKKSISYYGLAALVFCTLTQSLSKAYAEDQKAYKDDLVKAGYIYNFLKYVEWPGEKDMAHQSNIDICVLGDSPISNTSVVFKSASTDKLRLTLMEEPDWHNVARHCHVLVIGDSEAGRLPELLTVLRTQPVLTISEIDHFIELGGMIEFLTIDGRVKILVNTKPIRVSGLRIDSQLLEVAIKVINQ
jgi:YfiR/HmsC-like